MLENIQVTSAPVNRVALEPYPVNPYRWHAILETQDFYQTAEINTWTGEIASEPLRDSIHKPTDTPAVEAAKRTPLGQVISTGEPGQWCAMWVRSLWPPSLHRICPPTAPGPRSSSAIFALPIPFSERAARRADHPSEHGFISWITAKMGEKEWADALKSRRI
jgi:hypothetical protein